ncbi:MULTISPECIES: RagB/SusD family nutrient uptake outer membrane protein [unclassified Polaribacter]|uniref:RagB/SusD family nutrient uptake outer membrane protein n=1 Tax=unclassified Polaribacter TaxID=196858 RepID=UPI0011BE7722|nr:MULTISPECIES: RagB/SusD family nutrient uptake outer membrane protein [unclassified Polaribacter]TXD53138.1 RagB/SusD family nutrient uptake outer membrane protein [Polaribacter sp. IC063]TXD61258.1 RagB/SusD family nutrient uptake outer membrane protein [Polaribacter sp. IC066]
MKNYNKLIKQVKLTSSMLILLLVGYSCDNITEENPISEIGTSQFWLNNSDANTGVVAIYDALQPTYRSSHLQWGEFRSDNFQAYSNSTSINNASYPLNNIFAGDGSMRWNDIYGAIYRANSAIENIPNISGANPNLLAEALTIRAKLYFDAVRVWGAVPFITETVINIEDAARPATDPMTIMNELIIPDMIKAEGLFTVLSREFRFSLSSLYCLQAEVYMWREEFDKAKIVLDKLVNLGEYSLVTTTEGYFNLFANDQGGLGKIQIGPELIMSIRFDLIDADRSGIFNFFNGGIQQFAISEDADLKWREKFPTDSLEWVNKYPNTAPVATRTLNLVDDNGAIRDSIIPVYGDWRYFMVREGGVELGPSDGRAMFTKWGKGISYDRSQDDTDINLYRYADMLLMLAEAENQLDNAISIARSLEIVNELRTARMLPPVNIFEFGGTKELREHFLLDERRFELFGEGKRWWDLRRTDKAIEILNPILLLKDGGVQITQDRLLFPIFNDHLIENPLLKQNLGY